MKLAFVLFMYFPYGGLQRDFLRIATLCRDRGHQIRVYTMGWEGEVPEGFELNLLPQKAMSNHRRNESFYADLKASLQEHPVDAVVGFNRIPGLDVYFAADPCFAAKTAGRSSLYRKSERYRSFAAAEAAVFDPEARTEILMLTAPAIEDFIHYHGTPRERFHLLPPGISPDRKAGDDAAEIRADFRRAFELAPDDRLVLMVGSGFRTKGLDRALRALAALPSDLAARTRLFVVGKDKPQSFQRLARRLKIADRVTFLGGRDDVPRFLLGADLLIHPAYSEAAGMVLLEAVVAGLPVLVTDVCGYAHYVEDAGAGIVLQSPFSQSQLNESLAIMLTDNGRITQWQENGIRFGRETDLYSMPERAAEIIESVLQRGQGDATTPEPSGTT